MNMPKIAFGIKFIITWIVVIILMILVKMYLVS